MPVRISASQTERTMSAKYSAEFGVPAFCAALNAICAAAARAADINKQKFALSLVALAVVQSAVFPVQAQVSPSQELDRVTQEGLRQLEERVRRQQREITPQSDELRPEPKEQSHEALPSDKPCFQIERIEIESADQTSFGFLARTTQSYLGQCVGVNGLAQLATRLNASLIARGYATSKVSFAPQNLQSGIVRLTLNVGRISSIVMTQNGKPDTAWGTWKNALPLRDGEILNVLAIEQGLEQMKRLPSQSVGIQIQPGELPDTSILVIERKPADFAQRLRGGVTLDNSGSAALGRAQVAAYAMLDNPAGLNDLLTLSLNTNAERPEPDHHSQSVSLSYSIPWGYNTFSLTASRSRFAQNVRGTTAVFLSNGYGDSLEVRWQRVVWRTGAIKMGVYAATSVQSSNSFIDDVELIVQRRRTATLQFGVTYKHLLESAVLDIDVGVRQGKPWFDAQDDLTERDPSGPTVRPQIWTFNVNYSRPVNFGALNPGSQPFQYSVALRGQRTSDYTVSSDQIAIGSRYSVRGFDGDAALLAENGVILRQELSRPVASLKVVDATAFAAFDYGYVWGPSAAPLERQQVAGLAVGLRGRHGALSFDATLAAPLLKPSNFSSHTPNLYVSASYTF